MVSIHKSHGISPLLAQIRHLIQECLFLVAGDDLISDNEKLRDSFVGIGLRFNEDSLKPILSTLPIYQ